MNSALTLETPTAISVNVKHKSLLDLGQDMIEKMIDLGRDLDAIQSQLPYGGWTDWVNKNLIFSIRTAQRYLSAYHHRNELQDNPEIDVSDFLKKIQGKTKDAPRNDTRVVSSDTPMTEARPEIAAHGDKSLTESVKETNCSTPEPEQPKEEIPESNIQRLAEQIWKAAVHHAPQQEVDVAKSLLKLILRKFPELR